MYFTDLFACVMPTALFDHWSFKESTEVGQLMSSALVLFSELLFAVLDPLHLPINFIQ